MYGKRFLDTKNSQVATIGAASVEVFNGMVPGKPYTFTANCDCWITQGAHSAVTATTGAGSSFVPAKAIVDIYGSDGAALAAIQDSTGGKGCVTPMHEI